MSSMSDPSSPFFSAFSEVVDFVAALHPAAAPLRAIFQQVLEVQHNKYKCRSVLERAKGILRKINDGLRGVPITPHLQNSVNQLVAYAAISDFILVASR